MREDVDERRESGQDVAVVVQRHDLNGRAQAFLAYELPTNRMHDCVRIPAKYCKVSERAIKPISVRCFRKKQPI
jgi:hypothetical protein